MSHNHPLKRRNYNVGCYVDDNAIATNCLVQNDWYATGLTFTQFLSGQYAANFTAADGLIGFSNVYEALSTAIATFGFSGDAASDFEIAYFNNSGLIVGTKISRSTTGVSAFGAGGLTWSGNFAIAEQIRIHTRCTNAANRNITFQHITHNLRS